MLSESSPSTAKRKQFSGLTPPGSIVHFCYQHCRRMFLKIQANICFGPQETKARKDWSVQICVDVWSTWDSYLPCFWGDGPVSLRHPRLLWKNWNTDDADGKIFGQMFSFKILAFVECWICPLFHSNNYKVFIFIVRPWSKFYDGEMPQMFNIID